MIICLLLRLPQVTDTTVFNQYIGSGDLRILPAFLTAIVPIFNLPAGLAQLTNTSYKYATALGNDSNSGGIIMNMPILTQILTGIKTRWDDQDPNGVNRYHPYILERFNNTGGKFINPNITVGRRLLSFMQPARAYVQLTWLRTDQLTH